MQSAVNGQLGHWLQDGNACAVISFASGLVVMFLLLLRAKKHASNSRRSALIKTRKIPLWNWFAGLCGAMVVSEGASASALGVATFQTALISALLLSGLLCDRFGVGVDEKKCFAPWRVGWYCSLLLPRFLSCHHSGIQPPLSCSLSFHFGRTRWLATRWKCQSCRGNGLYAVSIAWNFIVGFCVLGAALAIRVALGHVTVQLPDTWWMYLGGPLGLLSSG
jgi:transporter family-2 protein